MPSRSAVLLARHELLPFENLLIRWRSHAGCGINLSTCQPCGCSDTYETQKLLLQSPTAKEDCSSQGIHVSCEMNSVENEVLLKTPSGWKIALGHTTELPRLRSSVCATTIHVTRASARQPARQEAEHDQQVSTASWCRHGCAVYGSAGDRFVARNGLGPK
jgi:hypothetical protein